MPIHDFKCPNCGEVSEELVTNKTYGSPYCWCGHQMEQLMGAANIVVKGHNAKNSYGLKPVSKE